MFSFIRNCQTVFQSGCSILHSHWQWMKVPCSISPPAFGVASVQKFGHSNRYIVLSHCFNFHFSHNIQCGASFQMLIFRLYILWGEESVKVFACFIFLLLSFNRFLYSWDRSSLSNISFAYNFSSLWLVFFLLKVSFIGQKFVILAKLKFSVISFMDQAFGVVSKMSLPNLRSPSFLPMFYYKGIIDI